tara:strand:- start:1832 stop:2863 length:1032 start_codon:yes stop_codon:yes gene_type:complete
MALVFDRIKSTPGEALLLLTALVTLVYSLNFMFFSVCYTTAGEDCFTLLDNGAPVSDPAYGAGAPEFAFNGILMFGIFMSTMLILNEGARGMWKVMLPVLAGLVVASAVIWMFWNDASESSEAPKYLTPIVALAYAGAYMMLRSEDEVDEGLDSLSFGIGIKDPVALMGLVVVIATGIFYVFRQIADPESVIDAATPGNAVLAQIYYKDGLLAPSKVTVAFTGALLLTYVLWAVVLLTQGARGMWAVAHPALFAFLTVTIANYFGFVFGPIREFSEQNEMDAISGPATMLIFLLVYLRLRDEGIEDGMTFQGEPLDSGGFDRLFVMVAIVISAAFMIVQISGL